MPLPTEQLAKLYDILESARLIQSYLKDISVDQFLKEILLQDAVLMRFEIIGESSGKLSTEVRALFSNLPFSKMYGLRNLIAHDYGEVDFSKVWDIVVDHLPFLIQELEKFFELLKKDSPNA